MSLKLILRFGLLIGLLLASVSLWAAQDYYTHLPERIKRHETLVLGQNRLVPGTRAALRVIVRSNNGAPLPGSEIQISLQPRDGGPTRPLFTGTANAQGTADITFDVPADFEGEGTLVIETKSHLGADRLTPSVSLARDYRLLLTSDKPIYQPGQVIHLRALALGQFDLKPAAGQSLTLTIADGKGNKVFTTSLTTSGYGVAAADFQLASQVNTGGYKITAVMGNTSSEKTVMVEHYVLPKFKVAVTPEHSFYRPGAHVRAALAANYFFGKPVSEGSVTIEGYTFDVERTAPFNLQGVTDSEGNFDFEFDLPAYIAGSDLDSGLGRYYLDIRVTDQAAHTETAQVSFPVAQSEIVIHAVPESGILRPGVENILYVLTSTPDGVPIETEIQVNAITTRTDRYGLAEVRFTPGSNWQSVDIQASAANGASASRRFQFQTEGPGGESILLRPNRPLYRVGEPMTLTLLATAVQGTVYLDMVREGQMVSARSLELNNGRAEVVVDLTPDLRGTLELHAYKILSNGLIVRDTRLVVVDPAASLNLSLTPDRDTYRPGDMAGLSIQATGSDGQGAQSAIGLAVVDEAVFALAEQDPGFAKLYFMLEQELRQPRYELHGIGLPQLIIDKPEADAELRQAQEGAAQASLAESAARRLAFSLKADSHEEAVRSLQQEQFAYFRSLGEALTLPAWLLPAIIFILSLAALRRDKLPGLSLALTFLAMPVFGCTLIGLTFSVGPLMLGIAVIVGLVLLAALAWGRNDPVRKWLFALLVVYAIVFYLLYQAALRAGYSFDTGWQVLMVLGAFTVGCAYVLQLTSGLLAAGTPRAPTTLLLTLCIVALIANACAPAPTANPPEYAPAPTQAATLEAASSAGDSAGPRLRQYFPETMLWVPEAVTDENGQLHLDFPVADTITTWRMTALASTRDGQLGSAVAELHVFQDFFIDLDLPGTLTVGDELSVPVSVFNYLPESQSVRLALEQSDWFELLDTPEKELSLAANDVSVVYFRIRARGFGTRQLKVTAIGTQLSDAIQKSVRVVPDGKQIFFTQSDRLTPGVPLTQPFVIPAQAIPGTQTVTVKIYPGVASQVVEGLDSILRLPNGCFEQTSSTTYPNVLVLDYLKAANLLGPEVQLKAENYINIGYQRLTTYEVEGGGFSLWGEAPADIMHSAYGLMEFSDMSRVYPVDRAIIDRTAYWLLAQQQNDGSWVGNESFHESTLTNLTERLPVTAYVTWGLISAGYGQEPQVQSGINFLREHAGEAADPYVLALVANALVAAEPGGESHPATLAAATRAALERLAEMAQVNGDAVGWSSSASTYTGSTGAGANLETTALATLALINAGQSPDTANAALLNLIRNKDSFGTWNTTQTTILALKALLASVRGGSAHTEATVNITLGEQAYTVQITPENFDTVQLVTFDEATPGAGPIGIDARGEGNLMYQISGSYYLPWEAVPTADALTQPVNIRLAYDRTQLSVNDTVTVKVSVTLAGAAQAESALIDLGVPPGFSVEAQDLAALVEQSNSEAVTTIERYELTGRQILVYVENLKNGQPLDFSYRLRAKFPLIAQVPASRAYDYYNPGVSGEAAPFLLNVTP